MEITKIPHMKKEEYDRLISENYVCRIAFKGGSHPYIAPFLYVFDGQYMYFLPTKYGRKIKYFREEPRVAVEVENYAPDFSNYKFVTLSGSLEEVKGESQRGIKKSFVEMIKEKKLSPKVLQALGYSEANSPEEIVGGDRNVVWRLVEVVDITALKSGRE